MKIGDRLTVRGYEIEILDVYAPVAFVRFVVDGSTAQVTLRWLRGR